MSVISRVGRKGVIVIPKRMRESIELKEGSYRRRCNNKTPHSKTSKTWREVSQLVAKCKKEELELEE